MEETGQRYDFTVIGTASTVSVLKVRQMPQIGRSTGVENDNFDEVYHGGKGFNICAALARLGQRVYPVLTYADIRQRAYLRDFTERYGLPRDGIQDPPEDSRGTTLMIQDEQNNHITMITQYARRLPGSDYFRVQTMDPRFFENSRMAILTVPMSMNTPGITEALEKTDIPLALSMMYDPYSFPPPLLRRLLLRSELIFMNEGEAAYICREFGLGAVTELFALGRTRLIAVTLGEKGSTVYQKRAEDGSFVSCHVDAVRPETDAPDCVGAGDAYVSGFLYGYLRGLGAEECAGLGGTLAAFVIEKDGSTTNLPDEAALLKRYAAIRKDGSQANLSDEAALL